MPSIFLVSELVHDNIYIYIYFNVIKKNELTDRSNIEILGMVCFAYILVTLENK
jgi:hypothetical protein